MRFKKIKDAIENVLGSIDGHRSAVAEHKAAIAEHDAAIGADEEMLKALGEELVELLADRQRGSGYAPSATTSASVTTKPDIMAAAHEIAPPTRGVPERVRVLVLLRANPSRRFSAHEIAAEMGGEVKMTSLRKTIMRLIERGQISTERGSGRYWYSGQPDSSPEKEAVA